MHGHDNRRKQKWKPWGYAVANERFPYRTGTLMTWLAFGLGEQGRDMVAIAVRSPQEAEDIVSLMKLDRNFMRPRINKNLPRLKVDFDRVVIFDSHYLARTAKGIIKKFRKRPSKMKTKQRRDAFGLVY